MNLFCIFFLIILNIFMPVICWGPLAKSAQDPTTIPDYISAKILDHNVNPSAHGLDGYSVYNHRAGAVLDHVDDSVTLQKLFFNRFMLFSQFESIDGWGKPASGIDVYFGGVYFTNNGDLNDVRWLYIDRSDPIENAGLPSDNPEFQTVFKVYQTTNQLIYVMVGAPSEESMWGFKIVNGSLYACWFDDAGNEYTNEITGITLTNNNVYRAVFTGGSSIQFYINDVLKYTATTTLPVLRPGVLVSYYQKATAAVLNEMSVQSCLYQQDNFNEYGLCQ